ncbi:MAG: Rne/Rng family ribonuclease, partial [Pseudomonadota bacterium]
METINLLSATNQVTRMLINATQPEELRVAIVKGASLEVLDIERNGKQKRKGGIYLARVRRIEPSLNAAFVEYGGPNERDGFLPLKEVAPKYYRRQPVPGERFTIRDALEPGQEIIVQVDKSERGNKGAALSTYLSLPGPFLVLMSDNENGGGVSRRIASNHRVELREKLDNLEVREGMSVIIRTAGMGRTPEELRWDLKVLMAQYDAIQLAAKERPCPFLIYHEGDVVLRAIRDYLWQDIQEILIDEPETYQRAHQYLSHFRPDYLPRLRLYNDKVPLFVRYQIEQQVTTAFLPEVRLENGASIVIDACEALVAIDVNSGKATEGSDIEDTALKSNLAAAREIARQLRLRDIGGLIVIDFIDMTSPRSQRQVEQVLMEALSV